MKKTILAVVVVLVAGVFTANAQTSGNVTVNINLKKFQTLTVHQPTVNIDFENEDHYNSGANSGMLDNHLTVSSTGAFVVKATAVTPEANATTSKSLGVAGTSPLSIISQAGTNALESATYENDVDLNNNTQIASSTKGQFKKDISVQYNANKGLFTNRGLIENGYVTNDMNINTYKVQVTYTISVN